MDHKRTAYKYLIIGFSFLITSFFFCKKSEAQVGAKKADTTKTKTKPLIFHRYILRGSDTMFILLQTLILSPEDVTPRNKTAVINWFNQNIKIDSTKQNQ